MNKDMLDSKPKILIIDDEAGIREQLKWSLHKDYQIFEAETGEKGLELVKSERPDIALIDLTLTKDGAEDEGLDVFEKVQLIDSGIKVIIVTGNEQKDLAIKAVQMGAYDFYKKPIDLQELKIIIKRALQVKKLESEVKLLTDETNEDFCQHQMVGNCPQMQEVYDIINRTSHTDATILINSESGTGKELVARAVNLQSLRKDKPFVVINCGAIPENLLESELFGHEKGAFTGAHTLRKGKLELADHGTVFLDEIGELSVALQVKLLRFLQEKEIERVGGRETIKVDIRIIAATNRVLETEIENGNFRADLFYRLSVITINLPPLRERGQDILLLADHFLKQFKAEYNNTLKGFSAESKNLIKRYDWPGNVRELENKVKRAVIMAQGVLIEPGDLSLKFDSLSKGRTLKERVENVEARCIRDALYRNNGNISHTAEELGVNRTTFYDLLNKYSIDKKEFNKKSSQ